ncbi:MAG: hypothetical protein JJ909_00400 [Roseivirga sp.]|nr:hypothetical protein [Roseivirga sp.]
MKQLITSVFLLASFLFSGTISAQTQQEKDIKRLIIGTWEGTISIEVDEEGNKVEIPKLRSFGSEENHNNEEQDKNDLAFNFNSAFEGRELFEGEPIHYAFIYDVSADTLLLGSQKWKVVKIDNNELQLLEIPELIPLRGYS